MKKKWEKPQIIGVQNKMEQITEKMADYVCGKLCMHKLRSPSESELEAICTECKMGEYINDIQYAYDNINSFDRSQSLQLMRKYSGLVRCNDCEFLRTNEDGYRWCNNLAGLRDGYLNEDDGCARGKRKVF